ncbi:translation initiation factor IF-2-like [Lutra lutra]|uniref:translation initiation factor IF-2-like n=1 Tax=Lutra lutra TaxID=9657 RepID=UPI001FD22A26|nr:translation initiation factor IF-2-like [Lutra lutra]
MRHSLGSGATRPVLARSGVAGSSQGGSRSHCKLKEPKERAGSTRGSRRRLPAIPARAALTASFLGVSAGGGPATLRPESCSSRAGATASRSAPGPPPGSPAPGPALSSPPRPQPYPPEAGARGLQASWRPAAPGARAARYRLPREKRQASLPRVAPRGQCESDFGLPLPAFAEPGRQTGGSGKGSGLPGYPLEGGLGATLP